MSEQVKGVDVVNVTAWFESRVPDARGPLSFELIAGGHSNLTYLVTDSAGQRYVLRRPPLGPVLATAHDMARDNQLQQSRTRPLPKLDEVHEMLRERQTRTAVVHGDYRLDNCLTDDDGNMVAVLDWELCTLGDPLADVGLLMVYWGDADDGPGRPVRASTIVEGFLSRTEILERSAAATGSDLSQIDYYVALGYWKLGLIIEGVYARSACSSRGADAAGYEGIPRPVERCADAADGAFGRLG